MKEFINYETPSTIKCVEFELLIFTKNFVHKNAWILDSDTTNNMTFDSTLLSSYTSILSIHYIIIV